MQKSKVGRKHNSRAAEGSLSVPEFTSWGEVGRGRLAFWSGASLRLPFKTTPKGVP